MASAASHCFATVFDLILPTLPARSSGRESKGARLSNVSSASSSVWQKRTRSRGFSASPRWRTPRTIDGHHGKP